MLSRRHVTKDLKQQWVTKYVVRSQRQDTEQPGVKTISGASTQTAHKRPETAMGDKVTGGIVQTEHKEPKRQGAGPVKS